MRRGILIVDDDLQVARAFQRAIAPLAPVRVEHSADAALLALEESSWSGLILDVKLGERSGLDVLATARELDPLLPALIVTNYADPVFINRALDMRASYACKPLERQPLIRFVRRALAASDLTTERLAARLDQVAEQHALTRSETEILTAAAAGKRREAILRERGVSPNTLHSQVQSLLRKLGDESLDAATIRLLRSVLDETPSLVGAADGAPED